MKKFMHIPLLSVILTIIFGTPTFSIQAQKYQPLCGDSELQITYDKNSSRYHSYKVETEICPLSNPKCTRDFVFDVLISQVNYVAPTDSTVPVKNCMTAEVDLPTGITSPDTIRIITYRYYYSVTNYTRKDHFLHPGKVMRSIIKKDGSVYIETTGEGTGLARKPNEWAAPHVWENVDKRLVEAVNEKLK